MKIRLKDKLKNIISLDLSGSLNAAGTAGDVDRKIYRGRPIRLSRESHITSDDQWSVKARIGTRGIEHPVLEDLTRRDVGDSYIHGEAYDIHDECFRCDETFSEGDTVFLIPAKLVEDFDVMSPFPYCEVCRSKMVVRDML